MLIPDWFHPPPRRRAARRLPANPYKIQNFTQTLFCCGKNETGLILFYKVDCTRRKEIWESRAHNTHARARPDDHAFLPWQRVRGE